MPGRRAVAFTLGTAAVLAAGCVTAAQNVRPAGYWVASRPDPTYYCYDCHGYRYLDPYYDFCVRYGYRYSWDRAPRLVEQYRQRYVALKESDRSLGRYRYPQGYRATARYREPRNYVDEAASRLFPGRGNRDRIRDPDAPGRQDGGERKRDRDSSTPRPRGARPRGLDT